jgi:hypothetical protein
MECEIFAKSSIKPPLVSFELGIAPVFQAPLVDSSEK